MDETAAIAMLLFMAAYPLIVLASCLLALLVPGAAMARIGILRRMPYPAALLLHAVALAIDAVLLILLTPIGPHTMAVPVLALLVLVRWWWGTR